MFSTRLQLLQRALVVVIAVVALGATAMAQAFLLYTPDEYLEKRTSDPYLPIGEAVGDFVDLYPNMGAWTLLFKKDGVERKVKCKDIWGFNYKGVLFRINSEGPIPVRLMTEGEVCYYENGFAHLKMQRDDSEWAGFELGHGSYLSRNIKGPIVPAQFKEGDGKSMSGIFRKEYSELEPLFSCIGTGAEMDHTRQCVVDFEAGQEVQKLAREKE